MMRRFQLVRTTDVTGVSGTGVVAEGIQFSYRKAVVHWLGDHSSTVVWDSIEDALHVHGHADCTQIVWLDDPEKAVAELDPSTVWIVPKVPHEDGFLSKGHRIGLYSLTNGLSPAQARELAAKYLALADESERRAGG